MAVVSGLEAALAAAARGATVIRLRAPGTPIREQERIADEIRATTRLPLVVTDRADLALAVGAAGVHLTEAGLAVVEARRLVADRLLIGRSVHNAGSALAAAAAGADYVLFGPVFATPTHPDRQAAGLVALRQVCEACPSPVLAIGGVDRAGIADCLAAGAAGVAAIRMFNPGPAG